MSEDKQPEVANERPMPTREEIIAFEAKVNQIIADKELLIAGQRKEIALSRTLLIAGAFLWLTVATLKIMEVV